MELIPSDLLMSNILLRLPVKSLVHCMCVSKEWRTLLKSQTFANMHLHQIAHDDNQNKFLVKSTDAPCTRFRVIDCEAIDDHLTIIRPFPFKVSYTHISFLSSCNGLVLVGLLKKRIKSDKFSDLILWNPLTGEYKIFSETNSPEKVYHNTRKVFELYYSSWDDDYKILHITHQHDVYVCSLKSDSWGEVDSTKIPNKTSYDSWRPGACLNEYLYFLNYNRERSSPYSVIRFDTKTELFTKIPTPDFQNWCSSLTVERGSIYLCHEANHTRTDPYVTELWKMKGEDGGWMKVATYLPMKHLYSHGCMRQQHYLLRDGYWLMESLSGNISKIDLENRHEIKCSGYNYDDFHQVKRYTETFVSPNQYAN